MNFPESISVQDIKDPNPDYDYDQVEDYKALYLGGEEFRERKDRFLTPRNSDRTYPEQYADRLARAHYINRAGGIIDWLAAAVLNDRPQYIVSESASEESREYWEGLNRDADGLGHPIGDVITRSLIQSLVHNRSYLTAKFDSPVGRKGGDGLDAKIDIMSAEEVTDWGFDNTGKLDFAKATGCELVRDPAEPWKQSTVKRYTWTFYDEEKVAVYEAFERNNQKDSEAKLVGELSHSFGMPVFQVYTHPGQWIMDRIKDVVVSIFNRDSATTKYLDDGAFQTFVLNVDQTTDTSSIVMTDMSGIKLTPGEGAKWIAPEHGYYEPLSKDQQYLKSALFESMQSTAINAASIPQAGRLSGEAVDTMREPLQVLLSSLAWPQYDAWQRITEAILEHREEPKDTVKLSGLAGFNATMDDVENVIMGKEVVENGTSANSKAGDSTGTEEGPKPEESES